MFIPFDRLYDYLDQWIHEDTIIYQFNPPGSRKIGDLQQINSKGSSLSWMQHKHELVMIMHDQEPLDLDAYDKMTVKDVEKICVLVYPELVGSSLIPKILEEYKDMGPAILRIIEPSIQDKMLISHSEINSPCLAEYEKLGMIGVYWWSHAIIAKDWYRYAKIDPMLDFDGLTYQNDFNIYNRAWNGTREYRLKFTDLILQNNLSKNSNIKFSPWCGDLHYSQHAFRNPHFRPEIDFINLPLNSSAASSSADYSSIDYRNCAIDVVLETLFDDQRQHLTEKTLRPIACGKPFILVSTAGSLQYLKKYGFQTFSDVIDESYDLVDDPVQRLTSIVDLLKEISNLSSKSKQVLFKRLHSIADENKKLFWSQEFSQKIIDEFVSNYQSAWTKSQLFKQGKNFVEVRKKILSWDPTSRSFLSGEGQDRTRKDIMSLFRHLHFLQNLE